MEQEVRKKAKIELTRYDPRKDKEEFIKIAKDFSERQHSIYKEKELVKEIDQRMMDLKLRNSIVLAKEDDKVIGAGYFSIYKDMWGDMRCIVHPVMTYKQDAFKKGIEEAIMRELFKYIKNTMNINKIGLFCKDSDSSYRSVLMKLGLEKSPTTLYELELKDY